jgi:hypothetical protein
MLGGAATQPMNFMQPPRCANDHPNADQPEQISGEQAEENDDHAHHKDEDLPATLTAASLRRRYRLICAVGHAPPSELMPPNG